MTIEELKKRREHAVQSERIQLWSAMILAALYSNPELRAEEDRSTHYVNAAIEAAEALHAGLVVSGWIE